MIPEKPNKHTLKTLKQLVQWLRSERGRIPSQDKIYRKRMVALPKNLATEGEDAMYFVNDTATKISDAVDILSKDLGLEYIKKKDLDKYVVELAIQCYFNPETDPTSEFISKHFKKPGKHRVLISIEELVVNKLVKLQQITLCPVGWAQKRYKECKDFKEASCIAMLDMLGTDVATIRQRSVDLVEHELRMLRIMLDRLMWRNNSRFRVGREYAIKDQGFGLRQHEDAGYKFYLHHKTLREISERGYDLLRLDDGSQESVHRKASMSARWIEQCQLSTDLNMKVLYSIFALEALFGNKGDNKMGLRLGYKCTLLSMIVKGSYPSGTTLVPHYYNIRSNMVHGKPTEDFNTKHVGSLTRVVQESLSQYLQLAQRNKCTQSKAIDNYMDNHKDSVEYKRMFNLD